MINAKKNDKVIVKGFTGIKLGVFEVTAATKKTITCTKKNGDELIFDRKSGKQINVEEGKEKYANSAMDDDGSFVAPSTRGAAKKAEKKAAKPATKAAPVEDDDDEDEDDEDEDEAEEEEPKPVKKGGKKPAKAAPAKKPSKKAPVVEDDDDEDDDDEDDDDDYEEIDD